MTKIHNKKVIHSLFPLTFLVYQTIQSQIVIAFLLGDKLNSFNLKFGIEGGYNRSYLSGIDESKGLDHFKLGFYFDIRIQKALWFNTDVRDKTNMDAAKINTYSSQDEEIESVLIDGYVNRNMDYFYIPLHLKHFFTKNKPFFLIICRQTGVRNKANDYFYNAYFDRDDVTFKFDIRDLIKRLYAILSEGFECKLKGTGMNLGTTYYYGMVNIMKNTNFEEHNCFSKSSAFYILDIPFGAAYKENRKNE